MKTLADFKRAMQKGTKWYRKHVNENDWVLRVVSKVCSDHVYVMDDEGKESMLDFPKATEFKVNDEGQAEIYYAPYITYVGVDEVIVPRRLVLTYRKA